MDSWPRTLSRSGAVAAGSCAFTVRASMRLSAVLANSASMNIGGTMPNAPLQNLILQESLPSSLRFGAWKSSAVLRELWVALWDPQASPGSLSSEEQEQGGNVPKEWWVWVLHYGAWGNSHSVLVIVVTRFCFRTLTPRRRSRCSGPPAVTAGFIATASRRPRRTRGRTSSSVRSATIKTTSRRRCSSLGFTSRTGTPTGRQPGCLMTSSSVTTSVTLTRASVQEAVSLTRKTRPGRLCSAFAAELR